MPQVTIPACFCKKHIFQNSVLGKSTFQATKGSLALKLFGGGGIGLSIRYICYVLGLVRNDMRCTLTLEAIKLIPNKMIWNTPTDLSLCFRNHMQNSLKTRLMCNFARKKKLSRKRLSLTNHCIENN